MQVTSRLYFSPIEKRVLTLLLNLWLLPRLYLHIRLICRYLRRRRQERLLRDASAILNSSSTQPPATGSADISR